MSSDRSIPDFTVYPREHRGSRVSSTTRLSRARSTPASTGISALPGGSANGSKVYPREHGDLYRLTHS